VPTKETLLSADEQKALDEFVKGKHALGVEKFQDGLVAADATMAHVLGVGVDVTYMHVYHSRKRQGLKRGTAPAQGWRGRAKKQEKKKKMDITEAALNGGKKRPAGIKGTKRRSVKAEIRKLNEIMELFYTLEPKSREYFKSLITKNETEATGE